MHHDGDTARLQFEEDNGGQSWRFDSTCPTPRHAIINVLGSGALHVIVTQEPKPGEQVTAGQFIPADDARHVYEALKGVYEPIGAPESDTPLLDALGPELGHAAREKGVECDEGHPRVLAVPTAADHEAIKRLVGREKAHADSPTPLLEALRAEIASVGREQGYEYDPGFPKIISAPTQEAFDALDSVAATEAALLAWKASL